MDTVTRPYKTVFHRRGMAQACPYLDFATEQGVPKSGKYWVFQEDGSQTHPYGRTYLLCREESVFWPTNQANLV